MKKKPVSEYEKELQKWVDSSENDFIRASRISWKKDSLKRIKDFRIKHNYETNKRTKTHN